MRKIKGYIFISDVNKAMEHEWFVEFLERDLFDIEFILFKSKDSALYNYIKSAGIKVNNYPLNNKIPIPFYLIFFFFKMLFRRPDFVHCHLFQASLIGITSAWMAGIKKRIYTRHHADVHHVYHPGAVKYDRWINRHATEIIAVSDNIREILHTMEQVPLAKITVIKHGIPEILINAHVSEEEIHEMKLKYGLDKSKPVIGVISRFVPEKGIQYIIPAFKKLLEEFPSAILVLANAKGKYEPEIRKHLETIPSSSYVIIPFENRINPLFKSFDVFVHAPIDATCEAFGQVYIEALSLQVPMVCTLSGIACDIIRHGENALVPEYKDPDSLFREIRRILTDVPLRERLIRSGSVEVKELTFEKKYAKIKTVYLR